MRLRNLPTNLARFLRAANANVAIIFAISLIPITVAAGAGLDLARGLMVRSNMAEAADAAALAVGGTTGLTTAQQQSLAQEYFNANYNPNSSFGTPAAVSVSANSQSVTVSVTDQLPTTLLSAAGIKTVPVTASSTVVWGQSKLWVALVLDNTGSMSQGDANGTKMQALQSASQQLLTMLQSASSTAGDVQVSVAPFAKLVNVGAANVNASWIDWTDWNSAPPGATPATTTGPGDTCPWTNGSNGFVCVKQPSSTTTTSTIPSSGTYSGYICPSVVNTYSASTGLGGHYYNGCYTSVSAGTTTTVSSGSSATCNGYTNCTCSGSGSSKKCKATNYTHAWVANNHNTWEGCIMDRAQNYDTQTTAPTSSTTDFPAANDDNCPAATVTPLGYNWTTLSSQINAMSPNGSTNQTIGLDHGMMTLMNSYPYNAPTLPSNTSEYVILVSDGLNTQDRWSGDGSDEDSGTDSRMALACTNAKAAGITIYTIFLDIGGTQGNSTVLQNCASDSTKYYDLTGTAAVASTFNLIAQQITSLRVSR